LLKDHGHASLKRRALLGKPEECR